MDRCRLGGGVMEKAVLQGQTSQGSLEVQEKVETPDGYLF